MSFLIGLLTVVLVLDCLLLILLVLIQLPKKEAGAGLAFGGAATDALFGAGTGNVLTKITKYSTVAFFVLAMILSVMQSHYYHRSSSDFKRAMEQQNSQLPTAPLPISKPAESPTATTPEAVPTTAPISPAAMPATVPATNN
jgi:preprotein translocase subunit SecG